MQLNDLRDYLVEALDFPTDTRTVREQIGATTLEAPDDVDSRTIDDLLVGDDETYRSADELFESLLSNAPEAYIGRKYYDDRGPNIHHVDEKVDDRDQSV